MTIQLYSSTDSGAPILNGTVGSLINVLDACLINGYGSRTPLGWTKPYSGANLAAYRMGGGSQRYIRIDDTIAAYSRLRGFNTMSDVNTGVNPFPTDAQLAGGGYSVKADFTSSSTARTWMVIGTNTYFYFYNNLSLRTASSPALTAWFFGDINAYGGVGNTLMIANISNAATGGSYIPTSNTISNTAVSQGHWMASPYAGGSSLAVSKHFANFSFSSAVSAGASGNNGPTTPDRITVGVTMTPFWLAQASPTRILRGTLPGSLAVLNFAPLSGNTKFTFDSSGGSQAGKKYIYLNTTNGFGQVSGFAAQYDIDGELNAPLSSYFLMFGF